MGHDKQYTLDEAAKYLKVSKRTILRYIQKGYLIAHRPRPRYTRIFKSELDSYKQIFR